VAQALRKFESMLESIQVILWAQRLGNMILLHYFIQINPL